jgi:hypothetical protein
VDKAVLADGGGSPSTETDELFLPVSYTLTEKDAGANMLVLMRARTNPLLKLTIHERITTH